MTIGITIGKYELDTLSLISHKGTEYDLSKVFNYIEIYEDIFGNVLSGSVMLTDAYALHEKVPIIGQEKLRVRFKAASYEATKSTVTDLFFDVFKIGYRQAANEGSQAYILDFFSPEMRWNLKKKLSKHYKGTAEGIVQDILKKELKSDKQFIFEPSKLPQQFIAANWNPFFTINWLGRRTTSQRFSGSGYLFFENTKSQFLFTSMEALFQKASLITYTNVPTGMTDKETNDRDIKQAFTNIIDMAINQSLDTANAMALGMYGNRLVMFDPISQVYEVKDFSYAGTYNKYEHLEENTKQEKQTLLEGLVRDAEGKYMSDYPEADVRFYPMHSSMWVDGMNVSADIWYQYRISQMQQMEFNKVKIRVNGDSARKAGDIVTLDVPLKSSANGARSADVMVAGRYLVTAIKHVLSADEDKYMMEMELVKDSMFAPIEILK